MLLSRTIYFMESLTKTYSVTYLQELFPSSSHCAMKHENLISIMFISIMLTGKWCIQSTASKLALNVSLG